MPENQQEAFATDTAQKQPATESGAVAGVGETLGRAPAAAVESLTAETEAAEVTTVAVTVGDVLVEAEGETEREELSKETLLPATGMVRLSPRELEVIDHPAFQRLFEIYQLGQTHLVYRGATHTRGQHAIGSLQMAMVMIEATKRNAALSDVQRNEHWQRGERLSREEVSFVRLGALLHDIGHLPAGHTLEDELGLLARHDGDERIGLILDRTEWHGRAYRSLRSLIDELYAEEGAKVAQHDEEGNELTPSELLVRLISSDHTDAEAAPGTSFRVGVCRDLIGNTICADLLDYLHRDFLHLGKPLHFDPRLLDYLEVVSREREGIGREDRLIINLKGTPRPRPDAVTAILDLLERRYQLAEIALFHRVKLSAAAMLERLVAEYRDTFPTRDAQHNALESLVPELLECSDVEILRLFERKLLEQRDDANRERVDGAVDLARRLRVRKLHRDLHILYEDDIGGPEAAAEIAKRFAGDPDLPRKKARADLRRAADDRLKALRTLERDFGLRPGDVVMYCPALEMNMKIAEVGIYVKGAVGSLADLDELNPRITGGHLKAQQLRFRRLWRISFAIDEDAYTRLERAKMLPLLRKYVEHAVLWIPASYELTAHDAVRDIAEDLTVLDSSPWFGHTVVEPALNREQPSVELPGGAPSVSSFIGPKRKTVKRSRRG
jgi:HD superfamily phosphohydrolase